MNPNAVADETQTVAPPTPKSSASTKKNPFDTEDVYTVQVPTSDYDSGFKEIVVSFPTDEQWCTRQRSLVTVRRAIGANQTKSTTPAEVDCNKDLLDEIFISASAEGNPLTKDAFDGAEAMLVLAKVERCLAVGKPEKRGRYYIVTMKLVGGKTVTHELKIPSQLSLMKYRNAAIDIRNGRSTVETRVILEPSAELWSATKMRVTGYADESKVPIIHKDIAVNEVVGAVNEEIEALDPEG